MADSKRKYSESEAEASPSSVPDKSASQYETIILKLISLLEDELEETLDKTSKKAINVEKNIEKLQRQRNKKTRKELTEQSDYLLKAARARDIFEENLFKNAVSKKEKFEIRDMQIKRLKKLQEEFKEEEENLAYLLAYKEQCADEYNEYEKALKKARSEDELKAVKEKYEEMAKLEAELQASQAKIDTNKETVENAPKAIEGMLLEQASLAKNSGDTDTMKEAADKLRAAAKDSSNTEAERKKYAQEARGLDKAAREQEAADKNDAIKEELAYRLTTLDGIKDTMADAAMAITSGLGKMFDNLEEPISAFYEYQAKYDARLQGSENTYSKLATAVTKIGASPFINQKKMAEKVQTLIDSGVNYNLELRAYIATVTEGIASTFDAFDSELMRLIRIQQSDSSAARLGMEAALTQIFNNMYSDTSYLNETSDSVSHALLDASAQLSHQAAAEFEYVVQKWLGSLYSVGVSSEAITNIATGLGYLGSGNIEQLSGNEALMSLLAMSASKGGTSLSDILTGNLTADKTNNLLAGMVEYLREIANNTDANNVTKSSMAQIFGLSNTDLRSISNLNTQDLQTIYDTNLNYGQALTEASNQLNQIKSRTHLSTMISNVIDNAQTTAALSMGSNTAMYGMYKVLSLVSEVVGDRGLEIPGIQGMGTGTASGIDVISIAKAVTAGTTLMAGLISSLGSIGNGGLPALSSWKGYEQSLQRGSGLEGFKTQAGFSENTSYSSRGSGSTDDVTKSSMESATDSGKENMSEEDKESMELAEKFYEEGRIYLKNLSDSIAYLEDDTKANSLRVSAVESLPVYFSNPNGDNDPYVLTKLYDLEEGAELSLSNLLKKALGDAFTAEYTNSSTLGTEESPLYSLIKSAIKEILTETTITAEIENNMSNPVYVTSGGLGGIIG